MFLDTLAIKRKMEKEEKLLSLPLLYLPLRIFFLGPLHTTHLLMPYQAVFAIEIVTSYFNAATCSYLSEEEMPLQNNCTVQYAYSCIKKVSVQDKEFETFDDHNTRGLSFMAM